MALTELLIHASDVDEQTMTQIRDIASHPAVEGLVAIMPDCHLGAGCVIGFTGRFSGAVIPNVVGVDIGCGVVLNPIEGVRRQEIDFNDLDRFIRSSIPLGMAHHRTPDLLEWFGSRSPERCARAKDLATRADEEFYRELLSRRPR
ncbi:MAG TPA: RNA-splicing ligase RtcB, partial [Synergistaceae bacterium]|nr:RNA-splicing ligase RtcB [Synergistaceae bacterium]